MDEDEQNRYVTQLKEEFDSCDTTGTGYLDKEELTALCHKLGLDAHLPLLLDILLGPQHYARVNFEEFKEGFVAVLSRSLDFSTSEEESSYLEPVPEEVSPKFVKGTKRYGRRSRPDKTTSVLTDETEKDETPSTGVRRAKLRRSTSLESVESLKSDEDTGSNKETSREKQSAIQHSLHFEAQGQLKRWKPDSSGSRKHSIGPCQEITDEQVRAVWKELGVGAGGSLNKQELLLVCDHIGLKDLQSEELDNLFRKLDKDQDGRVSLTEFQSGLFIHGDLPEPKAASTPARVIARCSFSQDLEERVLRSTSPSLLSATVGQRLLTRLDDGSGCTSPESVITFWTEEGIRNSRDILQTLDFSLEERLSLADLTLALDNELLVSGNGIHQAALISYKDEIQFLQALANQACQERDMAKAQFELTERRNLQLVREIDDRHAAMESLNESKIKDLEQEFREKLSALRSETEQENEVLLQQLEKERDKLREEVELLKGQEANLQEEGTTALKENSRLEEENCALKGKLSEAESTISKLKKDLDHILQDKYEGLDPNSAGLISREEHLSGIIKRYELQCRELQDRNDELSSELEVLKNQGSGRKTRQTRDRSSAHTWSGRKALTTESDSDDPEIKRGSSPKITKCTNKNALGSLESLVPTVSIETELAMEQLKERYEQEIQDLKIQLETKVNFYERTIELMKQNMEVERKEIAHGFRMEISELEEQKALAEQRIEQLSQSMGRLEGELKIKSEVMIWGPEQERRVQREQAELEQNYAREIGNIVHRLTSEKDQLEAELKLKMDQEVLLVREELEQQLSQIQAQFSEAQHSLLQQLHGEQVRLQEQTKQHCREMGAWEARVKELEQEVHKERLHSAECLGVEQAQICSNAAYERKKLEEKHQEEVWQLRECICKMQVQAELQCRAEEESLLLQRQLEDKLEEMCVQLEDNTMSMKAQDALIQSLTSELYAKEREMDMKKEMEQKLLGKVSQLEHKLNFERERKLSQQKVEKNKEEALLGKVSQLEEGLVEDKKREEELLAKLCQLTEDWDRMKIELEMVQNEKNRIQGNCNNLSSAHNHQQTQLDKQEKELGELRENLEKTQEALKSRDEDLSRQDSELKSVEMDRDRLMEERRSQGNVVKDLQAKFQNLSEDWDQLNDLVQNLQNALSKEQGSATQLRTLLNLEQEEKSHLLKENFSYRKLADQLSSQIVEMETESIKLTEELKELRLELQNKDKQLLELRTQLDAKAKELDLLWNEVKQKMEMFQNVNRLSDEVQLLTQRLEDKEKELCSLRGEADNTTNQLQQSLMDSQAEVRQVKEAFELEKGQMKGQLLEMERLVIALETVMDPSSPHRAKLDEVNSENSALKDRLVVLHQDVMRLEEEVNKKRKKLEDLEREYIKIQEEEERLHKENSKVREEVLELSARNLQLSNDNAELNSRLQSDQGTVQMLTEKLSQVCREQEETTIFIKELQDLNRSLEKEKFQLQASKQDEKKFLERELNEAKDKLHHLTEVESVLTSLTLKNQTLQQNKETLLAEAEEQNKKLEKLQGCINTLEGQSAQLHSQIYSMCKEKEAHLQEMSTQHMLLKESQEKVLELETRMHEFVKEKEHMQLVHRMQEETAASALQEQLRSVQAQCQELLDKLKDSESKLHAKELELQRLKHESLTLRNKQAQLETTKQEVEEQALRANTALSLSEAQHVREVQQLQEQIDLNTQQQLSNLLTQLAEEQSKTQQMEVQLHSQAQQARTQLNLQQEQYEKVMENMQERMDDVETKLKAVRLMLPEKVNQLKEQLSKNVKSDLLLKDLYIENAELMKALQITEQRQKSAEKKSFLLEEKVTALNKLLRKIAPASLSA
ncbi:ninein-like protein isoform X2 [Hemibagrus wyckioides]|uniref:ninein-like protein isoform X2 n=1 Tax=Hemibagrus wyckioides TaxID=337641 RepID=UPI00266D77EB|nr:ninein-like protein isoform X2 [Hemibagrus wyckioides]